MKQRLKFRYGLRSGMLLLLACVGVMLILNYFIDFGQWSRKHTLQSRANKIVLGTESDHVRSMLGEPEEVGFAEFRDSRVFELWYYDYAPKPYRTTNGYYRVDADVTIWFFEKKVVRVVTKRGEEREVVVTEPIEF